jgi:hypothetical protein
MDELEKLNAITGALIDAVERAGALDPEIALLVNVDNVKVTDTGKVTGADAAVVAHRKAHPFMYRNYSSMSDGELDTATAQFLESGRTPAQTRPDFRELDASRLSYSELAELEKSLSSAGGGGGYDAGALKRALARQRSEDAGWRNA